MKFDNFKKVITEYRVLTEADAAPAADPNASPNGGADAAADAGGDPGGDPMGGGLPDLGGGMGGGGMPDLGGGGMGGDPMGGDASGGQQQQNNNVCTPKYVRLVSYLAELYNSKLSNKKNLVLNLKVKVGGVDNLNDVHNANEVMKFMVDNLLKDDVKEAINNNIKEVKKAYKKIKENEEAMKSADVHRSISSFLTDVATYSYLVSCMNALQERLPEINYGIDREYMLDVRNAKDVFNEIKKNIDDQQKLLEIE